MEKFALVLYSLFFICKCSSKVGHKAILNELDVPSKQLDDDDLVDYVNSQQQLWKAEFNERFSSDNEETRKYMLGVNNAWFSAKTSKSLSSTRFLNISLPEEFDARAWWPSCESIGFIRDQSSCGSCWAFGAVEAMSDRVCIASRGELNPTLSADDILACCESCGYGCRGGYPDKAWEYWVENGVVTGGEYKDNDTCMPYPFPPCHKSDNHTAPAECSHAPFRTPKCVHKCNKNYTEGYEKDKHYGLMSYAIDNNEDAIRKELMTYGPIEVAFMVYTDFFHYKKGIYKHTAGFLAGGHAVKLIGWGKEKETPYWLIANSWGKDWGEEGFFKILRGSNECGIEKYAVAGVPKV